VPFPTRLLFARAAAFWLTALTIVPFTAPLASCELSDLLPDSTSTSVPQSGTRGANLAQAAVVHALPTVPARTGHRQQDMSGRLPSTLALSSSAAGVSRQCARTGSLTPRPLTKTILRI
jgi:hypothetical protein